MKKFSPLWAVFAGAAMVLASTLIFPHGAQAAVSTVPLCEITRTLVIGDVGEDVRCLQRYLNWSGYTVAVTGAGSPESETAYFGSLTSAAVDRWQEANAASVLAPLGLTFGTGNFGSSSFARYVGFVKALLGIV